MDRAKWQQPGNWAGIQVGIVMEQAREMLGDPHKTAQEVIGGRDLVTWFYGPWPGGGQVACSDGQVWNWVIPDWRQLFEGISEIDACSGTDN
jgi:hypothetical protein